MTEIHVNKSTSDISIDSWSVIEDDERQEDEKSINSDSSVEIIDIDPEIDEKRDEQEPEVKQVSEKNERSSFLTLDEFLQERLLDYDYEHAEKEQKNKKKNKKGFRRYKAPQLGISVFIIIILALTAFTTLCSTLSQTTGEKNVKNVEQVQQLNKESKQNEQILKEINDTIREMEKIKSMRFFEEIEKKLKNDTTLQQCPRQMGPPSKPRIILPKTPREDLQSKFLKCDKNNQKQSKISMKDKSTWIVLKEFLLDSSFHGLVSLIMTNIYLFALLVDFTRRPVNKDVTIRQLKQKFLQGLEKCNSTEQMRRYLFKQLPFWNVDIPRNKLVKKKATNTSKTSLPKKTNTETVLTGPKKLDSILFKSCPFLVQPKSDENKALIPVASEESGKSECERRFDELDSFQKQFDQLKENQRNRIRLLKQKFKNEISYIRDTEEESDVRAEKISRTSQKFIKKLKGNREKYLLELRKVKELRQKVADGGDGIKENIRKDAASGSYSVALPPIYDYTEKFKMIKEKFERENKQLSQEWQFQ